MIRPCDPLEAAPWMGERGLPYEEDAMGLCFMVDECVVVCVHIAKRVAYIDGLVSRPGTGPKAAARAVAQIKALARILREECGVKYLSVATPNRGIARQLERVFGKGTPVLQFQRRIA